MNAKDMERYTKLLALARDERAYPAERRAALLKAVAITQKGN